MTLDRQVQKHPGGNKVWRVGQEEWECMLSTLFRKCSENVWPKVVKWCKMDHSAKSAYVMSKQRRTAGFEHELCVFFFIYCFAFTMENVMYKSHGSSFMVFYLILIKQINSEVFAIGISTPHQAKQHT